MLEGVYVFRDTKKSQPNDQRRIRLCMTLHLLLGPDHPQMAPPLSYILSPPFSYFWHLYCAPLDDILPSCFWFSYCSSVVEFPINPLNAVLNPIFYLLALLAQHFFHVSRVRVKSLTLRLLMSCIYGAPILDVSRSHTKTQHSR